MNILVVVLWAGETMASVIRFLSFLFFGLFRFKQEPARAERREKLKRAIEQKKNKKKRREKKKKKKPWS